MKKVLLLLLPAILLSCSSSDDDKNDVVKLDIEVLNYRVNRKCRISDCKLTYFFDYRNKTGRELKGTLYFSTFNNRGVDLSTQFDVILRIADTIPDSLILTDPKTYNIFDTTEISIKDAVFKENAGK